MCCKCEPVSLCPGRFCVQNKDKLLLLNSPDSDLQHLLADQEMKLTMLRFIFMLSICGDFC